MSTDNKISLLVENQFPNFYNEYGPQFVAFVKAYYEWMEQSGQATNEMNSLLSYADVDTTTSQFLEYFRREVLESIPQNVLGDKALLIKNIRDLNKAKGSEFSYRLLFRMLYNEEISFFYPRDFILKASDGKWVEEKSVRLAEPITGDITTLPGSYVTGVQSGASGAVDRVITTFEGGLTINEVFLNDVTGTFTDGELVRNDANTVNGTITNVVGPVSSVTVLTGGSNSQVGDVITFGQTSGVGANGIVATVGDTTSVTFTLTDGGTGYQTNATISIVGGTPTTNAAFTIDSVDNLATFVIDTDTYYSIQDVPYNEGPTFVSNGANTTAVSAKLAAANVYTSYANALSFANAQYGTINAITVTTTGLGFSSLPTVTVTQPEIAAFYTVGGPGSDAVITPSFVEGSITSITINQGGTNYRKNSTVLLNNQTRNTTFVGTGLINVSGYVQYPGRYLDDSGWLSSSYKLQDNDYYQQYSYALKTMQSLQTYKQIMLQAVHQAGTKLFGTWAKTSNVEMTLSTNSSITTS